jgi:hypothetical protein
MRTHRFGRKLKLPSTIAIKHQMRVLMLEDLVKEDLLREAEQRAGTEAGRGPMRGETRSLDAQIA